MQQSGLNKTFNLLVLIFIVVGIAPLIFMEKGDVVLLLNEHWSPFLDVFFKYITFLGDGLFVAIVVVGLLFYRYFNAIIVGSIGIIHSIPVHVLKQLFFKGEPRPRVFFEGIIDLHFVEGVAVRGYNSFPSGHTASAFALFFSLSLFVKNKFLSALLFIVALLVGISRMYLCQHFYMDVYVGCVIGFGTGLLMYWFYFKKLEEKSDGAWKLNGKLF